MEQIVDDTSPVKVAREKFVGGSEVGSARYPDGDREMETDETLTISVERVGTRYPRSQQVASTVSIEKKWKLRARHHPNDDMKVYRTE